MSALIVATSLTTAMNNVATARRMAKMLKILGCALAVEAFPGSRLLFGFEIFALRHLWSRCAHRRLLLIQCGL